MLASTCSNWRDRELSGGRDCRSNARERLRLIFRERSSSINAYIEVFDQITGALFMACVGLVLTGWLYQARNSRNTHWRYRSQQISTIPDKTLTARFVRLTLAHLLRCQRSQPCTCWRSTARLRISSSTCFLLPLRLLPLSTRGAAPVTIDNQTRPHGRSRHRSSD